MRPADRGAADPLRGVYHDRIVSALGIASVVLFLPFAVNNFIQGRFALGVGTVAVVAILMADTVAVWRRKPLPIPLWTICLFHAVNLPLSIVQVGFAGMLWCYPTVLLFFFVLPRSTANIASIALLTFVTPLVGRYGGGAPVSTRFGVTLALVIIFSNVFLLVIASLHSQLADQAVRDPLTGVLNRRSLQEAIGDAATVMGRDHFAALLLIDIDHFKKINDEYGHAAGDQALRDVAAVLERHHPGMVYRIGGEEFAVVLETQRAEAAFKTAEDLRQAIAAVPIGVIPRITVSIGVADGIPGQSPDAWLRRADIAMYEAKAQGRDRVVAASTDGEPEMTLESLVDRTTDENRHEEVDTGRRVGNEIW